MENYRQWSVRIFAQHWNRFPHRLWRKTRWPHWSFCRKMKRKRPILVDVYSPSSTVNPNEMKFVSAHLLHLFNDRFSFPVNTGGRLSRWSMDEIENWSASSSCSHTGWNDLGCSDQKHRSYLFGTCSRASSSPVLILWRRESENSSSTDHHDRHGRWRSSQTLCSCVDKRKWLHRSADGSNQWNHYHHRSRSETNLLIMTRDSFCSFSSSSIFSSIAMKCIEKGKAQRWLSEDFHLNAMIFREKKSSSSCERSHMSLTRAQSHQSAFVFSLPMEWRRMKMMRHVSCFPKPREWRWERMNEVV